MSSLTRRIQRNANREKLKIGNFHSVGTKLGLKNEEAKDKLAREARETKRVSER